MHPPATSRKISRSMAFMFIMFDLFPAAASFKSCPDLPPQVMTRIARHTPNGGDDFHKLPLRCVIDLRRDPIIAARPDLRVHKRIYVLQRKCELGRHARWRYHIEQCNRQSPGLSKLERHVADLARTRTIAGKEFLPGALWYGSRVTDETRRQIDRDVPRFSTGVCQFFGFPIWGRDVQGKAERDLVGMR